MIEIIQNLHPAAQVVSVIMAGLVLIVFMYCVTELSK